MYLRHLSLADFRSYATGELALDPGITTLVGLNGQGKTNLVEAIGYLATLSSHRVATDQPLVRFGAQRAVIRGAIVRHTRETMVELELNPGRANRARLNRAPVPRPREVLGTLRTVLFAPEDLALVKGDPGERRRFLDDLLVARQPRWSAVRADYDRVLKQRNALLKSAAPVLKRGNRGAPRRRTSSIAEGENPENARESALHTLDVWNAQLASLGSQLLYARLRLLRDLRPHLRQAYETVSAGQALAEATYKSSVTGPVADQIAEGEVPEGPALEAALLETFAQLRRDEVERGLTLAGPHRDEVLLRLGDLPAKGYASHGESWSLALALRLAGFELLRHDLGDDPVLILDDVFAELDSGRRERLAALVAGAEQVLITAAVPQDVPESLTGRQVAITLGQIATPDEATPGQSAPPGPGRTNHD